jgi:hypothetical protein
MSNETATAPKMNVYHLLPHMNPSAPIYAQPSGKKTRIRLDKLPQASPYLKITFTGKDGKNQTIRLKLNTDKILLDEQMKDGIPANDKFTDAERNAVKFRNGVLMTRTPVVQKFLEAHPQFVGFEGTCYDVKKPMFTVYDPVEVSKSDNKLFKERVKAANKIVAMNLEESQNLLIRLHGSFHKPPTELEDCQNALAAYLDESDEAIAEILKEDNSVDDEVTILLGRLIESEALSFTAIEGQVAKKKAGKWDGIKAISSKEYTLPQRKQMFTDFLLTEAGKPLLEDLKNALKATEKKGSKTK